MRLYCTSHSPGFRGVLTKDPLVEKALVSVRLCSNSLVAHGVREEEGCGKMNVPSRIWAPAGGKRRRDRAAFEASGDGA